MTEINMNDLLSQMRLQALQAQSKTIQPQSNQAANFSNVFENAISKVNDLQLHSGKMTTDFELGKEGVELPQVMVATQKAGVAFQAMVEVRNKLVNAYQEIMNLPI